MPDIIKRIEEAIFTAKRERIFFDQVERIMILVPVKEWVPAMNDIHRFMKGSTYYSFGQATQPEYGTHTVMLMGIACDIARADVPQELIFATKLIAAANTHNAALAETDPIRIG